MCIFSIKDKFQAHFALYVCFHMQFYGFATEYRLHCIVCSSSDKLPVSEFFIIRTDQIHKVEIPLFQS